MERPAVNAAARWRTNHHRHRGVPPVAAFGREVHNLVEAAGNKIGELHLGHRPQPHEARANSRAHDGGFRNRRVHHAPLTEALDEARGHLEGAAVDANIFANQEDAGVALHLFPQTFPDGFEIRGHAGPESATGSRRRRPTGWPDRETGSARPRRRRHPPPEPPPRGHRRVPSGRPSLQPASGLRNA